MQLFDRRSSFALLLLCLPLLFFPKINLISLQNEGAGVRADDLVLVLFGLIIMWARFSVSLPITFIERTLFLLVGFSLFSFLWNRWLIALDILPFKANLFYCVRLFEYFLFFYVGVLATSFNSAQRVVQALFAWNILLMGLQKMGLIGGMSIAGYLPDVSSRLMGIGSFPNEIALVLNLIFCFLVFSPRGEAEERASSPLFQFWERTRVFWLYLLFMILILWTGSRIAAFALTVCFLGKVVDELRRNPRATFLFSLFLVPLIAFAVLGVIYNTSSISERSAGLLDIQRNVQIVSTVWEEVNIRDIQWGGEELYDQVDMSWLLRLHKWCLAVKLCVYYPVILLFGIGPGVLTAALDGGLLRILVEYGIVGAILFWQLFSAIYRTNRQLKWMTIAFLINMVFIDVYLAYKPMSLLFFVVGTLSCMGGKLGEPREKKRVDFLEKATLIG